MSTWVAHCGRGGWLSPGLELDVLDGDGVEGELEVVDGAHDGGVEAVGEDLGARVPAAVAAVSPGGKDAVVVRVRNHGKVCVQRGAQLTPCGRQTLLEILLSRHHRFLAMFHEDTDEHS